jgi:hypothetical protein
MRNAIKHALQTIGQALATIEDGSPGEEWRIVPGFDGRYSVSDAGQVRNNATGRLLTIWHHKGRDPRTYLRVTLFAPAGSEAERKLKTRRRKSRRGKPPRVHIRLHCLVWAAFHLDHWNTPANVHVHHIDANRHNCRLDNLEAIGGREHVAKHNRGEFTGHGSDVPF